MGWSKHNQSIKIKGVNVSKWEEWKEAMGETRPWHVFDPTKYVEDEELGKTRLEICKGCP